MAFLSVASLVAPGRASAQGPTTDDRTRIARRLRLGSVSVEADGSEGFGFVVGPERWIVTAYAVVATVVEAHPWGDAFVTVRFGSGTIRRARVLRTDLDHGLAVLEVEGGRAPALGLELGDSDGILAGHDIFAFGTPLGLAQTLMRGVVSTRRDMPLAHGTTRRQLLEIDAAIGPGPGGPLLDASGRVIAVSSRSEPDGGTHYAVPSNDVRDFVERVRHARAERAQPARPLLAADLGVVVVDPPRGEEAGVRVVRVRPGSPAGRGGIVGADEHEVGTSGVPSGTVILAVDGQSIRTARELDAFLSTCARGQSLRLSLRGVGGVITETRIVLDAPP